MEVLLTWIMIGLVGGFIAVSLLYPVVVLFINYLFRSRLDVGGLEKLKGKALSIKKVNHVVIKQAHFVLFCVVTYYLASIVACFSVTGMGERFFLAITYTMYLSCIALSLPLTRWLIDVARNLKIKSSTGDSEKIKDLQDQINKLKEK